MADITLALVSHTNVGKTTLARTLLRRDVGEVLDQAHVTEVSEAYTLIDTPEGALRLWDTPGFGDSVRLLARLHRHAHPVLWFLQQTWDRFTDRPLWSSQQAALTIRDEADVVLYLVNATEEPEDAGYVGPELELLGWIGRPVLLLLNQTGTASFRPQVEEARLTRWRTHTASYEVVDDVLSLDAFSRCWVQERLLFDRVQALLPAAEKPVMAALRSAWEARNLVVLDRALESLARYLAATAIDRETMLEKRPGRADRQRAMGTLGERLASRTEELMATLLAAHGLEGEAAKRVEEDIQAFRVEGEEVIDPQRGALLGGLVSGALSGLAADFLAGGLTFGGGMVAGAILGVLGGAGLARGYQLVKGEARPAVSWTPVFLNSLAVQAVLRYLAVAHFGRGQGLFRESEGPSRWRAAVEETLGRSVDDWSRLWQTLARRELPADEAARRLRKLLDPAVREILRRAYPHAAAFLA